MVKNFLFIPSKQDKALFAAYVAIRHELLTQNGIVNVQELIDWMIHDLATELMKAGDRAYIRHTCEKFGLLQPLCRACVMKGDKKIDKKVEVNNLPPMLATSTAQAIFAKLQTANILSEDLQPLCSRPRAALLAQEISERIGIKHSWTYYEQLWHRVNMRNDLQKALKRKESGEYAIRLRKILDTD